MIDQFAKDVKEGLEQVPKRLPSKYFYNKEGSVLFAKIMQLPEYYLTDAEHEILRQQTEKIIEALSIKPGEYFELIELGAGDGSKTIEILKVLENKSFKYNYSPIDISQKALDLLANTLQTHLPDLNIKKQQGDYFRILHDLKHSQHPKVVMFLGSNIGNMQDEQARQFLKNLSNNLSISDKIVLGVDLIKSKEIILPAYDDSAGITRAFNLNLLKRINNELGANFNLNAFEHAPFYDEKEGIARSSIVSKTDQIVYIKALKMEVLFAVGETIHTEISRKYDDSILNKICQGTGLIIKTKFTDSRQYFADYILEKIC